MWLLTFQEVIVGSISGNYNCQHFWKLELLTFRNFAFSELLESIIDKTDWTHCCNFKNTIAGIFYLVVRRPMLSYIIVPRFLHRSCIRFSNQGIVSLTQCSWFWIGGPCVWIERSYFFECGHYVQAYGKFLCKRMPAFNVGLMSVNVGLMSVNVGLMSG